MRFCSWRSPTYDGWWHLMPDGAGLIVKVWTATPFASSPRGTRAENWLASRIMIRGMTAAAHN